VDGRLQERRRVRIVSGTYRSGDCRDGVTYSLDIVADLLCDQLGDVLDEGVLDADLVAV
jgi:hypothetical protein